MLFQNIYLFSQISQIKDHSQINHIVFEISTTPWNFLRDLHVPKNGVCHYNVNEKIKNDRPKNVNNTLRTKKVIKISGRL